MSRKQPDDIDPEDVPRRSTPRASSSIRATRQAERPNPANPDDDASSADAAAPG